MTSELLLSDLKVFAFIVQAGNFTCTASYLGVSPAFVTKRIGVQEQHLGVRLFHRYTRRVVLGVDGEILYATSRKMMADVAALQKTFATNRNGPSGVLRVAASPCIGRARISPVLALLTQRYPQVEIWIELADRTVDLVTEGYDIDIRVGETPQQHLIGHRLANGARMLWARPSYLARHGPPTGWRSCPTTNA